MGRAALGRISALMKHFLKSTVCKKYNDSWIPVHLTLSTERNFVMRFLLSQCNTFSMLKKLDTQVSALTMFYYTESFSISRVFSVFSLEEVSRGSSPDSTSTVSEINIKASRLCIPSNPISSLPLKKNKRFDGSNDWNQ